MSMRVTITADVHDAKAADDFLDSFNEWVGHPEIEPLLLRVPHPFDPGATEAAYRASYDRSTYAAMRWNWGSTPSAE